MTEKKKTNENEAGGTERVQRGVMPEAISLSTSSILKGEIPFITFSIEGQDVGKLWGKDGVLSFEGDCEESAKIFFEQVIELNRAYLEA